MLLPGGSCPPLPVSQPPKGPTPEETFKNFRQALMNGDYDAAFFCFSENTKRRYPKDQFQMMLEWTVYGVLLRHLLVKWEIVNVSYAPDYTTATVTLQHLKYPEYKKDFIFVYENKSWRIDITMARLLGVPQEDEDNLFLPSESQE